MATITEVRKDIREKGRKSGHIKVKMFDGQEDETVVISIYKGKRPCFQVLESIARMGNTDEERETLQQLLDMLSEPVSDILN